jgi:hypothetical protein
MEQLLAHLTGDYLLQSSHMAMHKTSRWSVASFHAVVYTLPFLLITQSLPALAIISGTHAVIDRYRLAFYVSMARNIAGDPANWRRYWTTTGYEKSTPVWTSTWLVIVVDNSMHLLINFFALKYL